MPPRPAAPATPAPALLVLCTVLLLCRSGVRGLQELEVVVPSAVLVGETVVLECSWRLEDEETLYSVKWYRGKDEFYRYIPKELPHTRVFPQPGVQVDISRSGARRVVLQQATSALAGRFRCEVSADAPTFHTEIRSAQLEVVEAPRGPPQVRADRSWYGPGSVLRACCAAPPARPPANITWLLNNKQMESDSVTHELPSWFEWEPVPELASSTGPAPAPAPDRTRDSVRLDLPAVRRRRHSHTIDTHAPHTHHDKPLPTYAEVSLAVEADSFERGSLRLTCLVTLYNLFASRAELVFDAQQPEVASALGVRNEAESSRPRDAVCGVALVSAALAVLLTLPHRPR